MAEEPICGQCGEVGHNKKDCKNDNRKCYNCKGNFTAKHESCPARTRYVKQTVSRTGYGTHNESSQ